MSCSKNGEVRAVHPAQIAAAALVRCDYVRRVIALGIKGGRECEHFGRAELNAKTTGLAALDDNGNTSFCHGTPTLGAMGAPSTRGNYDLGLSQQGVTWVTAAGEG